MRLFCTIFFAALSSVLSSALPAQVPTPLPRIVAKDGNYTLMVDNKPFLILGAQINNSSAWPAELPKAWPAIDQIHANTIEAPIYWEQWEPTPGHYDPSMLHLLIDQARQHHVYLILLWYGSWKNASGHYTPAFIKRDETRVPHVLGRDGIKVDSLSPYSKYLIDADRAAFTALMHDLRLYDPQHTVLMVQVENEIGTYGTVRDFSPAAQKLFNTQVPQNILAAMHKQPGTWPEVFGSDADEFFYAWSIAQDVNQIAAAGKEQDPLPIYTNVAVRNPINGTPGSYPSGGAIDRVIPIWKATAPAIDFYAIDLYDPNYEVWSRLLDLYQRPDNALFIPESDNNPSFARYFYMALGHGAIGYATFGVDDSSYVSHPIGAPAVDAEALAPFAHNYEIFAPMDRVIAALNFAGKLRAVSENPAVHSQTIAFTNWKAIVGYGMPGFGNMAFADAKGNHPANGGAMVAQLGPDEFLVTGTYARIDFVPTPPGRQRQFIRVEEGTYQNGVWHMTRIWNGDQTDYGLNFTALPQVLRVTLATY